MGLGSMLRLSMLFSATDGLTGPIRSMVQSLGDLENVAARGTALVRLGDQVSSAGQRVTDAGATLRSGMASILNPVMAVEDSLAELQTVWSPAMGTMEEAMGRAQAAAVEWSNDHKASTAEFIKTAYQMGSAGLAEEAAIAGTRTALTLATAALGDNVQAANLLGQVYNTLGDQTAPVEQELTRLSDVMARTQQLYQIASLGQLNAGLQYAIPVSQGARVSFEQMNNAIGLLNTAGQQGSMAGTSYAAMLTRLADASEDLGFQLVRTADGSLDLETTLRSIRNIYGPLSRSSDEVRGSFRKAFGEEGARAVTLLTEKLAMFQSGLQEVTNSQGATARAAAAIESTSSAAWQRMKNQVQNAALPLGEQLLPLLQQVTPVLTAIISSVTEWLAKNPELTKLALIAFVVATGVSSVLGPVLKVAGGLFTMAGHAMKAGAWVGKLWTTLGGGTMLTRLAGAVRSVGTAFLGMGRAVVSAGMAFLSTPIGWIITGVAALVGLVAWAIADWEGFKDFWVGLWDSIVGVVRDAVGWIEDKVFGIQDKLTSAFNILGGKSAAGLGGPADEAARSSVADYWKTLRATRQADEAAAGPLARYRQMPQAPAPGVAQVAGAVAVPAMPAGAVQPMPTGPAHAPPTGAPTASPIEALERFRAMGGLGGDGATSDQSELMNRLQSLTTALDSKAGFDYPELREERGSKDETEWPPAYRDPYQVIPDRREERPIEQKTTVNVSLNVTAAKPGDEKRIAQMVMDDLLEQLRAQGVAP